MGTDVTGAISPHKLTANVTGTYRVWLSKGLVNQNANQVGLAFQKNGSTAFATDCEMGQILTNVNFPAGIMVETYLSLTATDFIQVGFFGTNAQAYSIFSQSMLSLSFNFFGMERVA